MASLNYTQRLLTADLEIVSKYTQNPLILKLHKLHNLARYKLT